MFEIRYLVHCFVNQASWSSSTYHVTVAALGITDKHYCPQTHGLTPVPRIQASASPTEPSPQTKWLTFEDSRITSPPPNAVLMCPYVAFATKVLTLQFKKPGTYKDIKHLCCVFYAYCFTVAKTVEGRGTFFFLIVAPTKAHSVPGFPNSTLSPAGSLLPLYPFSSS